MATATVRTPTRRRLKHPHVARYKGVQGGSPVIVGTRLDIATLAAYHNKGYSVKRLLQAYPHITPAQMYDAISYYYDHQEEIDELIRIDNDEEHWRQEIARINAIREGSARRKP